MGKVILKRKVIEPEVVWGNFNKLTKAVNSLLESPSGGFVWGTGTGTITDQTDLISYIDSLPVKPHFHSAADITSGVLTPLRGGTGINTYVAGQLLVAANTSALSAIDPGTNGYVLTMVAGMPAWAISPASPWGVETGKIYYTAGKVGIGTTTPECLLSIRQDGLTTEPTDGVLLVNRIDASSGAMQFSPALMLESSSLLGSAPVKHRVRLYLKPVASGGNAAFTLDFKKDSGAWVNMASFLSASSADSVVFASGLNVGAGVKAGTTLEAGASIKITNNSFVAQSASLLSTATLPRNAVEVVGYVNTSGGSQPSYTLRGFYASHSIVSEASNSLFVAFGNKTGDNYFNTDSGQFAIGLAERGIESSAKFQVSSATRGSLPAPRMTTSIKNSISAPAEALMVYDTTLKRYEYYNGTAFSPMGGGGDPVVDISSTSVVGWASFTTKKIFYQVSGKVLRLFFHLEGTSNSSAVNFPLPSGITAHTDLPEQWQEAKIINNGSAATGYMVATANSGTVNLYRTFSTASWANTGSKSCIGCATILIN